jgi:hypothetical protein
MYDVCQIVNEIYVSRNGTSSFKIALKWWNKGKYFTLSSLSYHFSPFENENYHRFIISLQANNLTSLSPYATDRIGGKRCNCSCFEVDQEMDAILLIIGIVYGVCRIVIKSVQQCTYFHNYITNDISFWISTIVSVQHFM